MSGRQSERAVQYPLSERNAGLTENDTLSSPIIATRQSSESFLTCRILQIGSIHHVGQLRSAIHQTSSSLPRWTTCTSAPRPRAA